MEDGSIALVHVAGCPLGGRLTEATPSSQVVADIVARRRRRWPEIGHLFTERRSR
jgi:hypothetical protein